MMLLPHFPGYRHCARAMALSAILLSACGEGATGPDDGNGNPDLGAIVVSPQTATVVIADSVKLTAAVTDSNGQPISGIVTWTSSNESRATVSSDGMVNALAAGSVTITASLAGLEGTSTISVTSTPTSPTLHELFSAYLGGSDKDMARDVAVMGNGTAIVVGSSQSADFPGAGAVQGPSDAFIVAFGPD
ncbi:MAG: Ig-like domain-containing protein, partial [Gemmatimonadales bacterium]